MPGAKCRCRHAAVVSPGVGPASRSWAGVGAGVLLAWAPKRILASQVPIGRKRLSTLPLAPK